jgi:hypothetical protein
VRLGERRTGLAVVHRILAAPKGQPLLVLQRALDLLGEAGDGSFDAVAGEVVASFDREPDTLNSGEWTKLLLVVARFGAQRW